TSVYFTMGRCVYNTAEYSSLGQDPDMQIEKYLPNGTYSIDSVYHELGAPWSTSACGEHMFIFERRGDDGLPDSPIAQVKLEVWPIATAILRNIEPNAVYVDRIPDVRL